MWNYEIVTIEITVIQKSFFFTIKVKETESSAEESDRSNTPSLHRHLPSSKPQKAKAHKEPPPVWGPGFPGFPPGPPPHLFRQVREILYFFISLDKFSTSELVCCFWFMLEKGEKIHAKHIMSVKLRKLHTCICFWTGLIAINQNKFLPLPSPREEAGSLVAMDRCPLPGLPWCLLAHRWVSTD